MLISSCRFDCGDLFTDIVRKKHAVEVSFQNRPFQATGDLGVSKSGSVLTTNASGSLQFALPIGHEAVGPANAYSTTNTSYANHHVFGYRFFFLNGYLKCIKKEVTYNFQVYTSNYFRPNITAYNEIVKQKPYRETFCHPQVALDSLYHSLAAKKYLQEQVSLMAQRYGIKIPDSFIVDADNGFENIGACYFAALDWFAYPVIRELNSPVLSRNMVPDDRDLIAPRFVTFNFKQLVHHYYKASTPKLLKEVWNALTFGCDYWRRDVGYVENKKEALNRLLEGQDMTSIVSKDETGFIVMGNKRLNQMVFTLGPAILNAMGFDYFYQAISTIVGSEEFNNTRVSMDSRMIKNTEADLKTILKSTTPKKLINVLFEERLGNIFQYLRDTASMLREYENPDRIPVQIRHQYPNGLRVNFNFKTLKELHDKVSTQYTIIKTESSKKAIPVGRVYAKLHGRTAGKLSLVVPDSTSTLAVWGKLLNICVASYGDRAVTGDTLILGVLEDYKPKYCIEFRPVKIKVQKLKDEAPMGTYDPDAVPSESVMMEEYLEYYPRLEEKHVGCTPLDTPDEDEFCHIPYMVQFRGERNSDPCVEDRKEVENLLIEWSRENIEFLRTIPGIFDVKSFGASINADAINNLAHQMANQGIVPNQLLLNPQDYNALQNINYNHHAVQHQDNYRFVPQYEIQPPNWQPVVFND